MRRRNLFPPRTKNCSEKAAKCPCPLTGIMSLVFLHSFYLHSRALTRTNCPWLTLTNLVLPFHVDTERQSFFYMHARFKIVWGLQTKLPQSASRVGRLRNEKDKNSSSSVDGSILKSFMNQGFSFKEEETGSGMESVSPCRVGADLWLNKGRSCRDSGKDLFRDVVVLHQQQ